MITPNYLSTLSCTSIVTPSGTRHSAHRCVAALEKGLMDKLWAITFELRLAAIVDWTMQMTSSHSQRLKVAVH